MQVNAFEKGLMFDDGGYQVAVMQDDEFQKRVHNEGSPEPIIMQNDGVAQVMIKDGYREGVMVKGDGCQEGVVVQDGGSQAVASVQPSAVIRDRVSKVMHNDESLGAPGQDYAPEKFYTDTPCESNETDGDYHKKVQYS